MPDSRVAKLPSFNIPPTLFSLSFMPSYLKPCPHNVRTTKTPPFHSISHSLPEFIFIAMDSAPRNNKRSRQGSDNLPEEMNNKVSREGSDNLPEEMNKRIRTDIFINLLDDDDPYGERDAASEDIASVIKSLEDEICFSSSSSPLPVAVDKQWSTDLGYLLEASDDELGLPPTTSGEAVESALMLDWETEDSGFGQIWGIVDEIQMGFDYYSDELFDFSDFSWRQESLPAV